MDTRKVIIKNKGGLHGRTSARIVQCLNQFKSDIALERNDLVVNGKSIMGILMLEAESGTSVVIRANGCDEKEAIEAFTKLIEYLYNNESEHL